MKSVKLASMMFCVLLTLVLAACGPASPSAAGSPAETKPPSGADLEAELSAPASLPDGDSVEVEFTLINNSKTDLYVLKWYTPLEGFGGEIFEVEGDGQSIPYEGPLAMRGDPDPESYVFLEAGTSLSVMVDLATAYDFSIPGTYTITFISPRISHVAETKGEMASSVDDLGPVDMPSNQITVEIASASVEAVSQPSDDVVEMIRAYLLDQKPNLDPAFVLSVEHIPLEETQSRLAVQVFRVMEGPFANESFLVHGETVLQMGTAFGGHGLTSLEVGDLDQDGTGELYFAYSFGSGIHQSRIGMYAPAYAEDQIFEADTVYFGDLGLFKADTSISVRVVEPDPETLTLQYLETIGTLTVEQHAGQPQLILQLSPGLSGDVLENLEASSARDGWERYVNEAYGFAFQYPPTWTLETGENLLKLKRGTLLFAIAFQWSDEDVPPPWTGIPAGDLESQEALAFMDGEIEKQVLVYEDKVKMLLYSAEIDKLLISMRLDDAAETDYQAIEISKAVQSEIDEIVRSFERQ